MTEALQILYEGWRDYRRQVKGYLTTPGRIDIEDWEIFKKMVFDKLEAGDGKNNSRNNTRS